MNSKRRVVLVTGATSGIGKVCAERLHAAGYRVYGAGRRGGAPSPAGFETIKMDVTSDESAAAGVAHVINKESALDVVINAAGYGIAGAVEETSAAEAAAQFDTNVLGIMRLCAAALPHMRARRAGLIINISSLGGIVSAPFHGLYCASKFAVEGLSEAMRLELAPFGVSVVLVEPGDFSTGFTASRVVAERARANSAYGPLYDNAMKKMEESEKAGPPPDSIAVLIQRIIESPRPRLRYIAAPGSQALVPLLKRLLPGGFVESIMASHFGLKAPPPNKN